MAVNGAAMREAYPPPPSLFNLYGEDDGTSPLPPLPPPVPTAADVAALREQKIELKVLGNPLKLSEPLVPQLSTQALYRSNPDGTIDFKGELRRLSAELLFMFVELLKTVVEQPGRYAQPLTSANMLLSNVVHLSNMLRPYQARATLEATLALQVATMREGIGRVRAQVAAADAALAGMARALVEVEGDTAESAARPAGAGGCGAGAGLRAAGEAAAAAAAAPGAEAPGLGLNAALATAMDTGS